ncbi:hypothetical protein GCM10007382_27030 [Salinibacterium xinjiangense]|nr:hypothetical protein GCM10007382_27030 [Salinibacterium xinjiangense]
MSHLDEWHREPPAFFDERPRNLSVYLANAETDSGRTGCMDSLNQSGATGRIEKGRPHGANKFTAAQMRTGIGHFCGVCPADDSREGPLGANDEPKPKRRHLNELSEFQTECWSNCLGHCHYLHAKISG